MLVYGILFGLMYVLTVIARLPSERRPTAVDETLMRWIEFQEEDDPSGCMNCVLVRVKNATGLPADKLPCFISVECSAFSKSLLIGDTDWQETGDFDTCFIGPLIDQDQNRDVTMAAAKPQLQFTLKHQPEGADRPTVFATGTVSPGAAAASSSAASESGGGLQRGDWCTQELKLSSSGSGLLGAAAGLAKRAGGSVGTLSVEVKVTKVNAAAVGVLKSNYYIIAMRNEFKKPWSTAARALAAGLFGMLLMTSLPIVGDMFSGCLYLSIHGLTTAFSLFCMSIPHFCKLFHIPLPSWVTYMSVDDLRTSGMTIASAGASGVWMCLWWGRGEACTDHFWMLEVLLCVDALLFGLAWWRGEGGRGLSGLLWG